MLVVVIMVIGGSTLVNAQSDTDEQLLACDRIADTAEKMACFDAVVKSLKQAGDAPVVESPSDMTPATDTPAVIAPAAAVGATAAATPASAPEPVPAAEVQSSPPTGTPVEPAVTSAPSAHLRQSQLPPRPKISDLTKRKARPRNKKKRIKKRN